MFSQFKIFNICSRFTTNTRGGSMHVSKATPITIDPVPIDKKGKALPCCPMTPCAPMLDSTNAHACFHGVGRRALYFAT